MAHQRKVSCTAYSMMHHGTHVNTQANTSTKSFVGAKLHMNAKSHISEKSCTAYSIMHHGTHINMTWHTHEWVVSHTWIRHITHMNAMCRKNEHVNRTLFRMPLLYWRFMSQVWLSHGTYECVANTNTSVATRVQSIRHEVNKLPYVCRVAVCCSVLQCVVVTHR